MTSQDTGWYRDPDSPLRHRYWNGDRWLTECERLLEQGHTGVCPQDHGPA